MSADRHKSVRQSLISTLLDGNTEAAFSAELVTAVSTEIGMGFVPISIRRQAMNRNLIPAVALRAVLLKGNRKLCSLTSFHDFGLAEPITRALAEEKYATPTPIQAQTIPVVLSRRDVIG